MSVLLWLAGCEPPSTPAPDELSPTTTGPGCDAPDTVGDDLDQDCDGVDGRDGDGDGVASSASGGADCDDADPRIGPTATDIVGDDLDQNCDGVDGTDVDRDGQPSIASGGADCDDRDAAVFAGAVEVLGDARDGDCDGGVDLVRLAAASDRVEGEALRGALGAFVAGGDLDGDGVVDLLAAEPGVEEVRALDGGRWVGAGGLGGWIGVLPDLDADGSPEWALGAPTEETWGLAYVGGGLPAGAEDVGAAARTTLRAGVPYGVLSVDVAEVTGDGLPTSSRSPRSTTGRSSSSRGRSRPATW
jgi:hypothetical protein